MNKELLRTIKFTLFSISAGLIEAISFLLLELILPEEGWADIAQLISLILSVLWNFTLNRKFTFQSAANVPIAMLKVAVFYLVFAPLSMWWTSVLVDGMGWNSLLIKICTMLINFVSEYLFDRFFVFGKTIDTAK